MHIPNLQRKILAFPVPVKMVEAVSLTKTKKLVIVAAADQDIAVIDVKVTCQFVLNNDRSGAKNCLDKKRPRYAISYLI